MFLKEVKIDSKSAACGADTIWDDRWHQFSHNAADVFFSINSWIALIIIASLVVLALRARDCEAVLSRSLLVMTLFMVGSFLVLSGLGKHASLENPYFLSLGAFFLLGTLMAYGKLLRKRSP